MNFREKLIDYSRGDDLRAFWRCFYRHAEAKGRFRRKVLSFICSRKANRHGGYIGNGAVIDAIPSLPHGLHGVYISRYAHIGRGCRIYQNVTIGEVGGQAPTIGNGCLIGAGAIIVGGVNIGNDVKIGAGAVVFTDVPDGSTVVSQAPRIICKGEQVCRQ